MAVRTVAHVVQRARSLNRRQQLCLGGAVPGAVSLSACAPFGATQPPRVGGPGKGCTRPMELLSTFAEQGAIGVGL